jgi:antitoxin CptB
MQIPSHEIRVKRIIHRANYRGFKEADLILGGFAKTHARDLNEQELGQLETLLAEKDHDIYDWISGVQPVPTQFDTLLFLKLCAFKPLGK